MSNEPFEKKLAEIFESVLNNFLSQPYLHRIVKSKRRFSTENEKFGLALETYSNLIKIDIENMSDEEKKDYFKNLDINLKAYFNEIYQDIIFNLPYFLFANHIFLNNSYSPLTYEAIEIIRRESDLDTPKKRKDAFIEFFSRFIYEKVTDGGSQTNWNKWTRMYFLSLYEKFSIVIDNARNSINSLKKQKVAIMDIKREVMDKYDLPEDLWLQVLKKSNRKDKLARKWASDQMHKDIKKELLEKMGFADSYLIKVLETAREEAAQHIPCKCKNYDNHKLIFHILGDADRPTNNCLLDKDILSDLGYESCVQDEYLGMALYFV